MGQAALVPEPDSSPHGHREDERPPRSRASRFRRLALWLGWTIGAVAALLVVVAILSYALSGPLTHYIERSINERLKGYTAFIGRARFNPFDLSVTLTDVQLVQTAHPNPPVARFPRLWADLEWLALFHGRLVAKFDFTDPAVHLDRSHVEQEARSRTPIKQRGWQEALEAIYPFKMDLFRVRNGRITYVDRRGTRPLDLSDVYIEAHNIRNVRSPDRTYPSTVHAEATVFGRGRAVLDGHADFLAEPHATFKGDAWFNYIQLAYFAPVLDRYDLRVRDGTLTAGGAIEYNRDFERLDLQALDIDGVDADYEYHGAVPRPERAIARKANEAAARVSNAPHTFLRADTLHVTGRLGMANRGTRPPYRVFFSDIDLVVKNFSNHFSQGPATAHVTAKFMGSGVTVADATFRPETHGPDFEARVAIEDTDMRAMNDLLRAYAKIDVASGLFSLFGELSVKNHRVTGWVKPLFHDIHVYEPGQDRDKSFLMRLREHVADLLAKIFSNRRRETVATETTIAGPAGSPKASTLEVIEHLVKNAFFKAILPGFEHDVGRSRP